MTDTGEKLLRDRVRKVVQRVHLPQFVNEIAETAEGLVRAELERAAGIADGRANKLEGEAGRMIGADKFARITAAGELRKIAAAIRKLKE